jgi:RNA polymerase sigma-70 factor (ECF subfamily)
MDADRSDIRDQRRLLTAAQAGDENAFRRLVDPYRRALAVHCYRMLGSPHDADDVVQETLLRAWRALGRFEPRVAFQTWLYRIATNACLDELARRGRRAQPVQPYPDGPVDQAASPTYDPEARYAIREGMELALLRAIQELPGRQRAILILRDVLGWSSPEVAELLDSTTAATNSALQRARATIESHLADPPPTATAEAERDLLGHYIDAFANDDFDALVSLLREDAVLRMPPQPPVHGANAIAAFLRNVAAHGNLARMRLAPTRANGRPAVAAHHRTDAGGLEPHGILVLEVDRDHIAAIEAFIDPTLLGRFGYA